MIEELVWITNHFGEKLEALIRKSSETGKFPMVIFSAGLGMTMHEWNGSFDEIAEKLNEIGITTVQFEYPIFDKDRRCREIPLSKRVAVLQDVYNWILQQPFVDKGRIGILAQSYGAATVIFSPPPGIKTFVFVSPALSPQKSIVKVYEERGVKINYNGDTSLPRSSGENTTVGKEFWKDVLDFNDAKLAHNITSPTLVVHGDQDSKIPVSDVEKFYAALGSKQKKLKIFKGGDHGITDVPRPMREEFLRDVVDWFQKTL